MNIQQPTVDLLKEKAFLGREFLTWLWFRSEEGGHFVSESGPDGISVSLERFMVLDGGEGLSSETVTCRGLQTELTEAKSALRTGKKVARAHIRLTTGEGEWRFTLDGATLDIKSLKPPATGDQSGEEMEDLALEARILERAYLIEQAVVAVDSLFKAFLLCRTDPQAWKQEKKAISRWIWKESA
ncbi:MAG TPA: hypothetical protein EYP57_10730 [Thermodesulfobacteriaceae bacterium]|nr:hypothetical protein [Thermodesulfobacteriaceae bacterium]